MTNIKPITFKLNLEKTREQKNLDFLAHCKKHGFSASFICKLALSYLEQELTTGQYQDSSGMLATLLESYDVLPSEDDSPTEESNNSIPGFSQNLFKAN